MKFEQLETDYGYAALRERDDGTYIARGMALGAGDVTNGGSGKRTYWPPDVVENSAEALAGKPFATSTNHTVDEPQPHTPPDAIAGEVTWSGYGEVDGKEGVLYETEVDDETIARNIEKGRIEVSPLFYRSAVPVDEYDGEYADDVPPEADYVATDITRWRDLSAVRRGASPSNFIEPGGETPMAAEALHAAVESARDESAAGGAPEGVEALAEDLGELPEDFDACVAYVQDETDADPQSAEFVCGHMRDSDKTATVETGDEPAESGADDGPYDDGEDGGNPSSSAATDENPNMTDDDKDNDLTEKEKAVLSAAEALEAPTEALEEYAAAEQPRIVDEDGHTVLETEEYEALTANVSEVETVMAEALTERTDLKESTVEALSFDALCDEFRNDDGDIDVEALVQEPETGEPSDDEPEALSDETLDEARAIKHDIDALGTAAPEALKEELTDLVDEESYDEALEVL